MLMPPSTLAGTGDNLLLHIRTKPTTVFPVKQREATLIANRHRSETGYLDIMDIYWNKKCSTWISEVIVPRQKLQSNDRQVLNFIALIHLRKH